MPRARPPDLSVARLTRALIGAPVVLPRPLDRASEAWWRARPRTRVTLAVALAMASVLALVGRIATSPYGPPVTVLVAVRDLPSGHRLATGDLERATWPAGLVPPSARTRPDGRLVALLPAGTVLTERHVDRDGPLGSLDDGRVAVAVPRASLPALEEGTRLDVVTVAGDGSGVLLAQDATVIAIDDDTVWFAVTRREATAVVAAGLRATVGVALLPDEDAPLP